MRIDERMTTATTATTATTTVTTATTKPEAMTTTTTNAETMTKRKSVPLNLEREREVITEAITRLRRVENRLMRRDQDSTPSSSSDITSDFFPQTNWTGVRFSTPW